MKLATFNVENLFARPKAMNQATIAAGTPILKDYQRLNDLIDRPVYSAAARQEMLTILARHPGLTGPNAESRFIIFRKIRGQLFRKPQGAPLAIVANGRADWVGWFELLTEPVDEVATHNTARVIGLLDADVLCIVEAENRPGLKRFNEIILPRVGAAPYRHVMLIDGNDDRGIDVGVLSRQNYEIVRILSHIDDTDETGEIFSRDCAEYEIRTPNGNTLLLLVNHFKSKIGGGAEKRLRQAQKVREIYDARLAAGYAHIAICGDLNEAPDQPAMDPLIRNGSTLTDIMAHPNFVPDSRPGTHGNATASSKLDYILMSPQLSAKVTTGGVERRGVWGGTTGALFPHLPEITRPEEAASDHAALFAVFDL